MVKFQVVTKIPVKNSIKYLNGNKSILIPDGEDNLYKYVKDEEKVKIGTDLGYQEYEHTTPYRVSDNNKTIAYVTDEAALYAVFENKDKVKVASDVNRFIISSDGQYIYYTDSDDNLYLFVSVKEYPTRMPIFF
ncbi:hypothetical protein [Romboutsia sp.]|uniref:hypothetical protein n=1 Tax=Romboutsia sp. TaxID=1965302 RepID=UPI003F350ECF